MAKTRFAAAVALFGWALWTAQGAAGQEPTYGVCDESVVNGCASGTLNDAVFPDGPAVHVWRCDGSNGGTNSERCVKFVSVPGVCDESLRNGCTSGKPNDAAFPDEPNMYAWRCDGLNAGANSRKCIKFIPVDGVCDDSVRNGCSAGKANDAAFADISTGYLWRCDGQHGGANSGKCFLRAANAPVDGVCDDSVRNGCAAGTANDDAFADISTGYLWRCDGQHGGANSDKCFLRVENVPVNGVCDDSARNSCSSGTANDAAIADTTSDYQWRCDGSHGGTNSGTCARAKPTVSCGGTWSPSPAATCSSQFLLQTRTCNAGCNDDDCATRRRVSGTKPPSNCEWGSWSQWSAWDSCSAPCGGGSQLRSRLRAKTTPEACGGACLGSAVETQSQACNTHACVVVCGDDPWAPAANTICPGQSFTQTRSCNPGCNTGDCSERRTAQGRKDCEVVCGAPWAPAANTICQGQSFEQTRSCNPGCNTGDCSERRTAQGRKDCEVVCGDDPWTPAVNASEICRGQSATQTRTCNAGCNTGNCATSRTVDGTKVPVNGVWRTGDWRAWGQCIDCSKARSRTVTCDPPSCGGEACDPASKPTAIDTLPCFGQNAVPGNPCRR